MEEIIWSSSAVKDANAIFVYISLDSKYYAGKWLEKLYERVTILLTHPQIGRVVPEINNPNIREIIEGNYRIMYRISKKQIIIYRIMHSARLFK